MSPNKEKNATNVLRAIRMMSVDHLFTKECNDASQTALLFITSMANCNILVHF